MNWRTKKILYFFSNLLVLPSVLLFAGLLGFSGGCWSLEHTALTASVLALAMVNYFIYIGHSKYLKFTLINFFVIPFVVMLTLSEYNATDLAYLAVALIISISLGFGFKRTKKLLLTYFIITGLLISLDLAIVGLPKSICGSLNEKGYLFIHQLQGRHSNDSGEMMLEVENCGRTNSTHVEYERFAIFQRLSFSALRE